MSAMVAGLVTAAGAQATPIAGASGAAGIPHVPSIDELFADIADPEVREWASESADFDYAQLANDLRTAQQMWQRYPRLVESGQLPEPLRRAYVLEWESDPLRDDFIHDEVLVAAAEFRDEKARQAETSVREKRSGRQVAPPAPEPKPKPLSIEERIQLNRESMQNCQSVIEMLAEDVNSLEASLRAV